VENNKGIIIRRDRAGRGRGRPCFKESVFFYFILFYYFIIFPFSHFLFFCFFILDLAFGWAYDPLKRCS
jgi:hypothetical protein